MPITLTNIPRLMRHPNQNWVKAPTLLEKWFSRPSAIYPNYSEPDTSTVTMDWVLSFPRARAVYDRMMEERVWVNEAAQGQIAEMLRRKGMLVEAQHSFNFLHLPAIRLDPDYVQNRPVLYDLNTAPDDLMGALGRFRLRIAIAGSVSPSAPPLNPGHVVIVNEIGVYAWDSFDFQEEQLLGCWNEVQNSFRLVGAPGWECVSNETFRNYRTRTGRGGDFLIFSDVRRVRLNNPDSFLIRQNT